MLDIALLSVLFCFAAVITVLVLSVNRRDSMGLPLAYIISLALIHVPGAVAYVASSGLHAGVLAGGDYIPVGIALTAIGMWSFIIGMFLVRRRVRRGHYNVSHCKVPVFLSKFMYFCLAAGWFATFVATPLTSIPTLGAAIVFGSSIWVLGVILGLQRSIDNGNLLGGTAWFLALLVYPVFTLTFGGFLSYGSTVITIVMASVLSKFRNLYTALAGLFGASFLGVSVFVNYFEGRTALREVVWSNAGFAERVSAVIQTFLDFRLLDLSDPGHLGALEERMNQNEFVGLSYERLQSGHVDFLMGRSFYEGAISVVPRVLWPEKPVFGGSPAIVSEMTGLSFNAWTSWGVGNVMEFYINFGFFSLISTFIILGMTIAWLDRKTSLALEGGSYATSLVFFLPGVALIQPNGSLVELTGGSLAAFLAAKFWLFLWKRFFAPKILLS